MFRSALNKPTKAHYIPNPHSWKIVICMYIIVRIIVRRLLNSNAVALINTLRYKKRLFYHINVRYLFPPYFHFYSTTRATASPARTTQSKPPPPPQDIPNLLDLDQPSNTTPPPAQVDPFDMLGDQSPPNQLDLMGGVAPSHPPP